MLQTKDLKITFKKATENDIKTILEVEKSQATNKFYSYLSTIAEVEKYLNDLVISFYAIFHTPRETHGEILKKIKSFLKTNGLLLITMGSSEWEGKEDNFFGGEMSWSHYGKEKNRQLVEEAGFEILLDEIDESGEEKHQVILAKKT